MTLSEHERRLQFLGLTEREVSLLQTLRPLFERHVSEFVDEFYRHLEEFPETARRLHDRTTRERLKGLQRAYLLRITEGNFDAAYFADRQRIGQTHERVGLLMHWHLLAYSLYFKIILPFLSLEYKDEPARIAETLVALEKVLLLDASLAMDAYLASDRYRHMQFFQSILRDSVDVLFLLDAEKKFRIWNPAAERVFGWRAAEVIGKSLEIIYPPDLIAAGEMRWIDDAIDRHGHAQLETERLAKDGHRVPVDLSVSLLRDPEGQPIGRCAILRDITERKRLEEAKLQAERLAVIGTMSAKLAHEIRNPLSSITLNIDLVRDEIAVLDKDRPEAGKEMRALLQSIDTEVRRIQRVTEDYLQFAKMPRPRHETVALNEVLTQGLSFLQTFFDTSNVVVRREFDPALPVIIGDDAQLWQAILNLLRNAVEAMPCGGTLTIRTGCGADGVRLTVADTGKGMTTAERAQLFKPFYSTKPGGTGLGLPLTQQIVVEHGGRIQCETAPDCGTTFAIELPFTPPLTHAQES